MGEGGSNPLRGYGIALFYGRCNYLSVIAKFELHQNLLTILIFDLRCFKLDRRVGQ